MSGSMESEYPIDPPKPFFKWAARYSLMAPLATALVVMFILFIDRNPDYDFMNFVLGSSMLIVISSLLLGVIGFFGVMDHGAPFMMVTAIAGVVLSCVVGFGLFVLAIGNSMGHGC